MPKLPKYRGFTLIELLVVIAIIAILLIIALNMVTKNLDKASDAKVKSDLHRLKIAFEDYYADHNCYPPSTWFDDTNDCGSNNLAPYLSSIPCDPSTAKPFVLETDSTGCGWFKIYTTLRASMSDPAALAQCNPNGSTLGNFAVSSGNVLPSVVCSSSSSGSSNSSGNNNNSSSQPLPSIDPAANYYYCSSRSNCTSYDPLTFSCSPSYTNLPSCDGGSTPCQTVGSCTHR